MILCFGFFGIRSRTYAACGVLDWLGTVDWVDVEAFLFGVEHAAIGFHVFKVEAFGIDRLIRNRRNIDGTTTSATLLFLVAHFGSNGVERNLFFLFGF